MLHVFFTRSRILILILFIVFIFNINEQFLSLEKKITDQVWTIEGNKDQPHLWIYWYLKEAKKKSREI